MNSYSKDTLSISLNFSEQANNFIVNKKANNTKYYHMRRSTDQMFQNSRKYQTLDPQLKHLEGVEVSLKINSKTICRDIQKHPAIASFLQAKDRQERAKEFVSLINKEKRKSRGYYFVKKQQEQQKKKLKTEVDDCENKLIKNYLKAKRQNQVRDKIEQFKQRSLERASTSGKNSVKLKSDQMIKESKLKLHKNQSYTDSCHSQKAYGFQKNKPKSKRYQTNEIYLNEQLQKVQQTRKMLVKFSKMIDREQKIALDLL